ncbi:hypothetical protein PybrP1_000048 [[Pythium] brassicae (nom. inval.)]|nr:hypothetical protein PybrP1_000048 [[Pythium] brassicae (nom. inval.)]
MAADEKKALKLQNAVDYYYLNQGKCIQVPEINDKKDYKELVEAMGTVGIDPELQKTIFTLVACVLHLGNMEFTENAKLEAQIARPEAVQDLAELLMVAPSELEFALTKRTMSAGARGSVAEISLSAVEASKSRNGLAKDIFSKLFDWLVSQINNSTKQTKLNQTHLPQGKQPEGKVQYYSKPRFAQDQFTIHHYAGEVTYNVTGFLEKNDDSLHNDLISLMDSSKCAFLRTLFPLAAPSAAAATANGGGSARGNALRKPIQKAGGRMTGTMTVGRKFRDQMADLMLELNTTAPSFVRCVKPNNLRFPTGWNASLILNQLIYLGVMETVRIRRSGFPVRRSFEEFHAKYQILTRNVAVNKRAAMTDKDYCEVILRFLDRGNWQLGHKKVFLRDSQLRVLDNEARKITHEAATQIQKHVRRMLQRRKYLDVRAKVVKLQATVRMFLAKQHFQRTRRRVTLLNALARQFVQRRRYQRLRRATVFVQARVRGKRARRQLWYLRHAPKAATLINAHVRGFLARRRFRKQQRAASLVASVHRMRAQRLAFLAMRRAASVIAARYKGHLARRRYAAMQRAALVLHAVGRGFLARLKFGKKARARAVLRNRAQRQIARIVRGFLARRAYQRARHRVIMIQARVRANKVRTEYLKGREATINSQAMIRRALVRRRFLREKKMATRIAAFGRMIICRQRYAAARRHIVRLQSLWRMQRQRRHVSRRLDQVVLLQSLWRCHAATAQYRATRAKIVVLQAFSRMVIARSAFLRLQQAARVVQGAVRTFLGQRMFKKCRRGITRLQARVRGARQRCAYQRTRSRIVLVQSVFRQRKANQLLVARRRALARVHSVLKLFLSRVRMRNRTKALFAAAHAYNLTEVLHIAQEVPGMLRVRDRWSDMMSLVHVAAKNGDLNLARFVLEENPQLEDLVYGKDAAGSTPLHYAARLAHLDMVKLLAKIANRNAVPVFDAGAFSGARERSASSASVGSNPDEQLMGKLRSVSSVSSSSQRSPTTRSPSKTAFSHSGSSTVSLSLGANTPHGGDMRRRGMSTMSSTGSSFSMVPTAAPGDAPAGLGAPAKRPGRRSLVSSGAARGRGLSTALPPVLPATVQLVVHKEGFLRKASGTRWANKRYVVIDEVCLSYYKAPKERIPLKLVELCDATIQRISHVDNCFEIHSPRLKSSKNPEGVLSFVADSEDEVHEWMAAIRKVRGVRVKTSSPPFQNMICIDTALRREYVNMANKLGFTPLHVAVQNEEDEGFEAAKVSVWLIENGADVNAVDANGDTALHYAVMLNRFDLVETLMKRGADPTVRNAKGLSPADIAPEDDIREILDPAVHAADVAEEEAAMVAAEQHAPQHGHPPANAPQRRSAPLRKSPARLADSTYVSVFLGAVAVATGPIMETPHFNLYVLDAKGAVVEAAQRTPKSLIQAGGNYWWFGNSWYLQTPLEHLKDGCVAVMELRHKNLVTDEIEVGCWTFFRLDLSKITSAPVTFEMYAAPVDPVSKILARIPGDSFLQAEINVSL